jgi:hypothetical protein
MASSPSVGKLYYKREIRGRIKAATSYQLSAISFQLFGIIPAGGFSSSPCFCIIFWKHIPGVAEKEPDNQESVCRDAKRAFSSAMPRRNPVPGWPGCGAGIPAGARVGGLIRKSWRQRDKKRSHEERKERLLA